MFFLNKVLTSLFLLGKLVEINGNYRELSINTKKIMEITRETAREKLPLFRDKYGITLDTLSNKTGIAKSTLIAIEKGHHKSSHVTTIFKLNKYIGLFPEK